MKIRIALSLILLTGVVTAIYYWQSRPADMAVDMPMNMAASTQDQSPLQPLYWVAPMDANYRRDEPGLSPMGMPLIPVFAGGDTISVSASVQQNLGVRTAPVLLEDFSPRIRAVGYTNWDESSIQILHTRVKGWLEEFYLASVGDRVRAGEPVYALFAPDLVSVQREFLTAIESNNSSLASLARDRLAALGFTPMQINELDRSREVTNRLVFQADRDAIVTHIGVRKGNYVEPSTTLATLASLEKVWIETEVFEVMAGWIEPGLPVQISFAAFPGETWSSEISYLYPELDPTTRSLRLRIVIDNAQQRLRPNMFANVEIDGIPKLSVLTVPREAVIRAGLGDRVILSLGDGRFRPQIVQVGVGSGSRIEILSGLSAGDLVVTSGQFLLDSEAYGEQAFARLTANAEMDSPTQPAMVMNSDAPMNMPTLTSATTDEAEVYSTSGVITQIATGETMTISHQPVAALGWPAMVMGFQIPSELDISTFAVGDSVMFEFSTTPEGMYRLSSIRAQGEPQ
ncbi:MAG: efflux RND transporter periplasmic adaptor subunit [Proteobacteria bacterium]|nr:efflux RND transporter periplasmic adaptor subunit [Pseudomonadota bacterium]